MSELHYVSMYVWVLSTHFNECSKMLQYSPAMSQILISLKCLNYGFENIHIGGIQSIGITVENLLNLSCKICLALLGVYFVYSGSNLL